MASFTLSTLRANHQPSFKKNTAHWDRHIREFWDTNSDRYYEMFYLCNKLVGCYKILDVGAEYYNKYMKQILFPQDAFLPDKEFCVVDIKDKDNPDISGIEGLDNYFKTDLTKDNIPDKFKRYFDAVISFGVLSAYDINEEQCIKYINNIHDALKVDGICAIKLDLFRMHRNPSFPPLEKLMGFIKEKFSVFDFDAILDDSNNTEYLIYYTRPLL